MTFLFNFLFHLELYTILTFLGEKNPSFLFHVHILICFHRFVQLFIVSVSSFRHLFRSPLSSLNVFYLWVFSPSGA